jgi:hypothetical protein
VHWYRRTHPGCMAAVDVTECHGHLAPHLACLAAHLFRRDSCCRNIRHNKQILPCTLLSPRAGLIESQMKALRCLHYPTIFLFPFFPLSLLFCFGLYDLTCLGRPINVTGGLVSTSFSILFLERNFDLTRSRQLSHPHSFL